MKIKILNISKNIFIMTFLMLPVYGMNQSKIYIQADEHCMQSHDDVTYDDNVIRCRADFNRLKKKLIESVEVDVSAKASQHLGISLDMSKIVTGVSLMNFDKTREVADLIVHSRYQCSSKIMKEVEDQDGELSAHKHLEVHISKLVYHELNYTPQCCSIS